MKSTGIADTAFFGPEAEFFLFNGVSFGGQRAAGGGDGHYSHYKVESVEGDWHNADARLRRRHQRMEFGPSSAQQRRLCSGSARPIL